LRLELGHKDEVREKAASLLEELDRYVVALSGSGTSAAALASMASQARTLATALQGLIDFDELAKLAGDLGDFLDGIRASGAAVDKKTGGILMHAVGVLRQGLAQWGTGSRAGRLLPRIVADMRRVLASARKHLSQREPRVEKGVETRVETHVERNEAVDEAATLRELRESFLTDESGTFARLYEFGTALEAAPPGVFSDGEFVGEIFRLFHTIKGNALALGLEPITKIAHAAEDLIQTKFSTKSPSDAVAAAALAHAVRTLRSAVQILRMGGAGPNAESVDEAVVGLRRAVETPEGGTSFRLAVRIGGRELMIPCENVVEVLRAPEVMALPSGRPGWAGAVRSGGGVAPLIEPSTVLDGIAGNPGASWVVVLKPDRGGVFSLPIDEPGEVVETDLGETVDAMIDFDRLLERVAA
jgi:chemotaxis protein histidine kinase CheA